MKAECATNKRNEQAKKAHELLVHFLTFTGAFRWEQSIVTSKSNLWSHKNGQLHQQRPKRDRLLARHGSCSTLQHFDERKKFAQERA
jgi:hypothetical protein